MDNRLYLHTPTLDELWYRKQLMSDPNTMGYNSGYDLDFEGYDRQTGCIAFPESQWRDWYAYFIGQEPKRYYAYIVRLQDNAFIGEVNIHKNDGAVWHEMGIVIRADQRGKGYAVEALRLLLKHAFEVLKVDAIHNDFEASRDAAVRAHLSAGFSEYRRENGLLELLITKEQYDRTK